jgi:AraC-like DNA-binding protein
VVTYPIEAHQALNQILAAQLSPRTQFLTFRAGRDMGILLSPSLQFCTQLSLQQGDYYNRILTQFAAVVSQLNETLGFPSLAALSGMHHAPYSVRKLYLETKTTFDYSWAEEKTVCTYPLLKTQPVQDLRQESALEQEFMGNINRLLFSEADIVLGSILELQFRRAVPLEEIIPGVIARLWNALAVLEVSVGLDTTSALSLSAHIARLSASGSVPELKDRIHDFFTALSDFSPKQPQKKGQQVLEFIESNYQNPALSAQMICDRFRISQSYLSKVLKKETGSGLVDHIHDIRVDHAKQLLTETSQKLEQIALQVGFSNRYSLIRAFRQKVGLSPSEYRQQFRTTE